MKFSSKSISKLATCHHDLQVILTEAIKYIPIDFGISHGQRSSSEQMELYKKGRVPTANNGWVIQNKSAVVTYLDGYAKKSKHNESPSHAVDIFCWPNAIMYDEKHLAGVGVHIMATAARLLDEGKITHRLKWGNDWNMDGIMIHKDPRETFTDMPHFELVAI